jgi:hypothetical protein
MFYCSERKKGLKGFEFHFLRTQPWIQSLKQKVWNKKFETFMIQFFEQNHKSSRARDRNWRTQCRCSSIRGREWLTNGPAEERAVYKCVVQKCARVRRCKNSQFTYGLALSSPKRVGAITIFTIRLFTENPNTTIFRFQSIEH